MKLGGVALVRVPVKHCREVLPFVLFGLIVMLSGCSKQHVLLDRAVVLNATSKTITEVKVVHEPTKKTGEVNAILPRTALALGFSGQPLLARQATVSWRDSGGVECKATVDVPYDAVAAREGRVMDLIYVIQAPATVTVHLENANIR